MVLSDGTSLGAIQHYYLKRKKANLKLEAVGPTP